MFCEDKAGSIVTACDFASSYLINSAKVDKEKVKRFYLGVKDSGLAPFEKDKRLTIVSCSNLISLKRVFLIPEVLQKLNMQVRWIHIGDGEQMSWIQKLASGLPESCEVELLGRKDNVFISDFYQMNNVHLFIHLSETEGGVPVVLQEAGMAGIPLMAVNVGGVAEIVNSNTGILINGDFTTGYIAERITSFLHSSKNSPEFRMGVRKFVKENFYDETNYNAFINEIFGS
jgi:glycosyltransferase involved in cell wall biosynthesis